jgi:hypothetical protein
VQAPGPGWTRGPYGGCHLMRPAYGFYARPCAPYAYYGRRRWWRAGVRVLQLRLFARDERSRRAIAGGFSRSSGWVRSQN